MSTESNQRAYKHLTYIIGYSDAMMCCDELESLSKEAIIELYRDQAQHINRVARSGLGEKIDE